MSLIVLRRLIELQEIAREEAEDKEKEASDHFMRGNALKRTADSHRDEIEQLGKVIDMLDPSRINRTLLEESNVA